MIRSAAMPTFLRLLVLAGIAFATLSAAADELTLNGSGIRKRVFFEVYSIGLYLPKKTASAQEAIAAPGPKRIDIRMLRNVSAEQFSGALAEGIRENHSEAEARTLEPQVKQLTAVMAEVQEAKKGMLISLGWDGKATQLRIDGKSVGAPIEGEDFYRALLRIWLGEKPVQEDLKNALLGAAR
jgi:hypothetical protein